MFIKFFSSQHSFDVICVVILLWGNSVLATHKLPELKSNWWGEETDENIPVDENIYEFKISVPEDVLTDLNYRLENARYSPPLEDAKFHYGFNTNYLYEVINYWKTKYNWRKQEKVLNSFEGFMTLIDGIDVHFLHVKPKSVSKDKKVIPLLITPGWPGSVYEFYKLLPILITPRKDKHFVFEVVCPHIPGHGFSEAPNKPGFGPLEAAQIFEKLMSRLGFNKYYIQGGDWGAQIAEILALYFPDRIEGIHLSMATIVTTTQYLKMGLATYFPSLLVDKKDEFKLLFTRNKLSFLFEETGHLHMHATKPDTIGVGLNDSPVGLAAYILEKFSTWVDPDYRDLEDGGLTKKFTLDELLTNVMIYWVTGSITSSMRFYKEFIQGKTSQILAHHRITVPTAIAVFPKELTCLPESLARSQFSDIVQYTDMPRGGHFGAFEEPKLMADDIYLFVQKVENRK